MLLKQKPKILTMRYIYALLVFMIPFMGIGQVYDVATQALNTANVELLEPHLNNSVDITLRDEYKNLSKSKALQEIKNFLIAEGSISTRQRHKGNSKSNNSDYKVLLMKTSLAKYRVFVYTEMIGDKRLIKELRFDKV